MVDLELRNASSSYSTPFSYTEVKGYTHPFTHIFELSHHSREYFITTPSKEQPFIQVYTRAVLASCKMEDTSSNNHITHICEVLIPLLVHS